MGRYRHLTLTQRAQGMLAEAERLHTPYDSLLAEKQRLFGLEDWYIFAVWADSEMLENMTRERQAAAIDIQYQRKWAKIYCHRELMAEPRIDPELVFEHELAHILINPTHRGFFTNEGLEHTQVVHIGRACQMLREQPEEFRPDPADPAKTIGQAYRLTRLDVEHWYMRYEVQNLIQIDGRRLGAYAESLFHENHRGLGVLSARQIDFYYDEAWVGKPEFPDHILEALWRVVLNPYSPPDRNNVTEATLQRIMGVMKRYGWNNGKSCGCSGGCSTICGEPAL